MRIAIDYTPAVRQQAGIGRYTRGLVRALADLDPYTDFSLLVLGKGSFPRSGESPAAAASGLADSPPLPPNFHVRHVPIPYRLLTAAWHRLRLPFPAELLTGPVDLFHSPDFVLPPLREAAGLITVHDLAFLRVPECADPRLRDYLTGAVGRSVDRADHILADSKSTQGDLVELLRVPAERISVVPAGVEARFHPNVPEEELQRVRAAYALDEPFILSLGTIEPRKNHARLIQSHALLRQRDPATPVLVIAGGRGWLYEEVLAAARQAAKGSVRLLGFVADQDLPALYASAQLFAFPSLYEGFGLPPLEAMACGTPVVCSNRPSLPEIVGDAALMVDAEDVQGLSSAMQQLLEDEDLRERMIRLGLQRAKGFTWEQAGGKLLAVYQEMLR